MRSAENDRIAAGLLAALTGNLALLITAPGVGVRVRVAPAGHRRAVGVLW